METVSKMESKSKSEGDRTEAKGKRDREVVKRCRRVGEGATGCVRVRETAQGCERVREGLSS